MLVFQLPVGSGILLKSMTHVGRPMPNSNIDALVQELDNHPDYRVLRRLPEYFTSRQGVDERTFTATIIDLETMGMDAYHHEIIEIGLLSFTFSNGDGILTVTDTYNELNDPGKPIPEEITKITGITDEDVKGRAIDWNKLAGLLKKSHLILCHNSRFDRNFLELQTNDDIKAIVEKKPFGCTIQDIDWRNLVKCAPSSRPLFLKNL